MLTQRSRYALRAMLFLTQKQAETGPVPMNRIAAEANVPRKFLELILADLREAGFLDDRPATREMRGAGRGLRLSAAAAVPGRRVTRRFLFGGRGLYSRPSLSDSI